MMHPSPQETIPLLEMFMTTNGLRLAGIVLAFIFGVLFLIVFYIEEIEINLKQMKFRIEFKTKKEYREPTLTCVGEDD